MHEALRATLLLALLVMHAPGCDDAAGTAEGARRAVATALTRGDRAAALDAIQDLREAAGGGADAQLEVAGLLVRAGNAAEAAWVLEDAERRHPARADVALARARVALVLGNPALARELTTAPDAGAEVLLVRAQAELQLGDLEGALDTLSEAETLDPTADDAHVVRVAALLAEQRHDEALVAAERARAALAGGEAGRSARELEVVVALLRARRGETEVALESLASRLRAEPADLLAWRAWVGVLVGAGRTEEALAGLAAPRASGGAPAELGLMAADLHARLGEEDAAARALGAYAAQANTAAAYHPLVRFHAQRADGPATLAVLDEAVGRFPEDASLRFHRAEALLAAGRVDDARTQARRFRDRTFRGDPQVEFLEARFALAEGDAESAAVRLRNVAPRLDRAATHYWLGRALAELGDLEGARRRYALARGRDPSWIAPLTSLLDVEEERGDARAMADLARAWVALVPSQFTAWVARVAALVRLGEHDAAEAAAREACERFSGEPEAYRLLAEALRGQGRIDEALAALDRAGRLGDTPRLVASRIRTLAIGGRVDEAMTLARSAAGAHPDAPEVHAALAAVAFAAGAAEEGSRATDRALALAPGDPTPLRERCLFRASTRDWGAAGDDCTRYLDRRSGDPEVAFLRGLALEALGETQAAISAYRNAAARAEGDARALNNLAGLLFETGDLAGALAAAQEAHRRDGSSPFVLDTLGVLFLEKGLVDRAISLLEDARRRAPGLAEARFHLALAYREAGRHDEATALLAELRDGDDARPELRALAAEALDAAP